jgi:DHA1 family bicyclomycin/chloramphenicol resistance-like MFS transporter
MPETLPTNKRQRLKPAFMARSYYKVFTTPAFMLSCCSMALFMSGFFVYIMSAPQFLMTHLKLHETEFLWMFGPIGIGMITGAWFSGHIAGKISGKQTAYIGYSVMAIAAVSNVLLNLLMPPMLPWSILPIVLYAVGMSIAMPSMTLMGMDLFPDQRGLAASVQGFIMLGANAVVPALVPMVWGSTLSMALTELVLLTGALLTLFLYLRSMKNRVSQPVKLIYDLAA